MGHRNKTVWFVVKKGKNRGTTDGADETFSETGEKAVGFVYREERVKKTAVLLSVLLLLTAVLLPLLPIYGEGALYEKVVRLHVLGQSDGEEDQAVKLRVRDAVLAYTAPLLADCTEVGEAERILSDHLSGIRAAAEGTLLALGKTEGVTASLRWESYPTRSYGDFTLPAGRYPSLQVIIGEGRGKNWWCVLFPSLCGAFSEGMLPRGTEEDFLAAGFTPEQYRIIRKDAGPVVRVRFKILEMLSSFFGFSY